MVQQHNNPGSIVPQDSTYDAADQPGLSHPYSQNEIEDLLYGADRPVAERLQRLKEIRAEMAMRESGDFGEEDPADMIEELDRAIEELQLERANADETGDAAVMAADPADHLDSLAPDDIEARAALIGEEEFYDEDEDGPVDDDHVWQGSDEFRPDLN